MSNIYLLFKLINSLIKKNQFFSRSYRRSSTLFLSKYYLELPPQLRTSPPSERMKTQASLVLLQILLNLLYWFLKYTVPLVVITDYRCQKV